MTHIWCNGQWIDAMDFAASPTDRGLTVGLGLFETILAIDGHAILLDRHLARLAAGCDRLGWVVDLSEMADTITDLLQRNDLADGRVRVRLAISGGTGKVQDLTHGSDHLVWMMASPVDDPPVSTTASLSPWPRNERSPLVGLKCASYAENLLALDHAKRLGFDETIFLNAAGHVCEAATSNLFLVHGGVLATPPLASGCLPGITRARVIELAAELGIPCRERVVQRGELDTADELFLTSAIRGIMGVAKFEARELAASPITAKLRGAWIGSLPQKNRSL